MERFKSPISSGSYVKHSEPAIAIAMFLTTCKLNEKNMVAISVQFSNGLEHSKPNLASLYKNIIFIFI